MALALKKSIRRDFGVNPIHPAALDGDGGGDKGVIKERVTQNTLLSQVCQHENRQK